MARTTSSIKHTHQYHRVKTTGLWHCSGIDGCTHYMPRNMPEPAGRKSICWQCEKEFLLTPVNMKNDKPLCDNCEESVDILDKYLQERLHKAKQDTRTQVQEDEVEVYDPDSE